MPIAPSCTSFAASWKCGHDRCWRPICTTRLYFRAASSICNAGSIWFETGFSQNTSLPAAHASIVIGLCQ
jgi:hypothetical protein